MALRKRSDRPSDPRDPPTGDRFPDISVETGHGRPASSGVGERLVLGVAVLALLGGLLIIGGKVVGDGLTAKASATPSASPARSGTPQPTASATSVAFTLQPGPLPSTPPAKPTFNGWLRALRDVPLYSQPDRESTRIGVLKKGALAFGYEKNDPGIAISGTDRWIQIQDDNGSYVPVSSGKTQEVELLDGGSYAQEGYIEQVVAGPDQFVVVGSPPVPQGGTASQFLAVSRDGETWEIADHGELRGQINSLSYGPVGWVAVTQVDTPTTSSTVLWRSEDAVNWALIGSLPDPSVTRVSYDNIRASPAGYLLRGDAGRGQEPNAPVLIWSADATHWQQVTLPADASARSNEVVGTPWGFYLESTEYSETGTLTTGYSSLDGRTWIAEQHPPTGSWLRVAPTPTGLVGVSISPIGNEPRAWVGTLQDGVLRWQKDDAGTAAMRGAAIPSLLSDGATVIALGGMRDTFASVVFNRTSDGAWSRDHVSAQAFGGTPPYTGAGLMTPGGSTFIAVGSRPTLASGNETLWRGSPTSGWKAIGQQLLPYVPDPPRTGCPSRPSTALDFAMLDPPQAVSCFGGEAMTFRAWAVECMDCGTPEPGYAPSWLADPNATSSLSLSPIAADGTGTQVAVGAGLPLDPSWDHHWVQVIGHFDDPAARSCRFDPGPQNGPGLESRVFAVIECRKRFVVTRVTLVDGP